MRFNQASLNEGNAFDTTTGKFTAPIDGVYSFSWAALSDRGKYFVTEIVLNSNPVIGNYVDGRGHNSPHVMSSSQANIKMKKGEKVWIRVWENYGQVARCGDKGQWCYFSGFKL